jgi:predicted anti-sigma-YlaC factor YlaD
MFCCKKAAQLASESLDRELSMWQRAKLQVHLAICRSCRHFTHDLHRLQAALRIYSKQVDADAGLQRAVLRPEARQRIRQAMENM